MTSREKYLVTSGLAVGIALGVLAFWAMSNKRNDTVAATPSPAAQAPTTEPATGPDEMAGMEGGATELSQAEQEAIGLRVAPVTFRTMRNELRTVGRVEQAETQLAAISARVGGRIDKLYIDFTGQPVKRGQAIASIYSPQVFASAEEYKLALRARGNLGTSAHPQAIAQADDLIEASRRRLELWGLSPKQIDEIAQSDKPKVHITTYSSVQGIVTERKVAEGQYVQEGETLYTVSDLSSVWVMADVYEADLHTIRMGHSARVEAEALPGTVFRGAVSFIDPTLNTDTRTASVRIQLANPGLRLRPGMFVQVTLAANASKELAIPRSAVLDTGGKKVVYLAKGDGVFERRTVELGGMTDDFIAVRQGLKERENVVINGAFMIDSQTRVSGGMSGMFGGSMAYTGGEPSNGAGTASKYTINVRLEPDPLKGEAPARALVDVMDPGGKAVADVTVSITLLMPAMPSMGMAEMRNTYPLKWDGKQYSGEVQIRSAGPWTVTVDAMRSGQRIASKRTQVTAR